MYGLGGGSDYTVFLHHLGIPSVDFGFYGGDGSYHSRYDSYWFFTNYGDPGFAYGEKLTELVSLFLLRMADARVLPFDYASYSETIDRYIDGLQEVAKQQAVADVVDLGKIRDANARLKTTANSLNEAIARLAATTDQARERNKQALSRLNDLLLAAESAFIDQNGLPRRPWYRHQIYAPSLKIGYVSQPLPGVQESIERKDVEQAKSMTDVLVRALERVERTLHEAIAVAERV